MKRRILECIAGGVVALSFYASAVWAHHSHASTYFETRRMTIEGEIVQVSIRNPHSWLFVAVKDPASGEAKTWAIEWAAGAQLNRVGVDGKRLRAGDHVLVEGAPPRNTDQLRMLMKVIRRPADGWTWGNAPGEVVLGGGANPAN